ncbi:MAG: LysR family transcriptional regulator [Burkholderiales bacterium]|nr:LysR family transcriptional regulator [Burkholderiales bacterium]
MSRPIALTHAPLGALRAFESAARLGSFKAAAAELFVTPAAISHQILALEGYLGTVLFERLNRAVRLTPTGSVLAQEVSAAFARIDIALQTAAPSHARLRNRLVISAVPTFASRWLAPRLHRFHAQHPEINLRLSASEVVIDLAHDDEVDVALRYGPGPYADLHAELLWPADPVVPVCSPALLTRLPAELALLDGPPDIPLLRVALPQVAGRAADGQSDNVWTVWLAAARCNVPSLWAAAASGPLFSTTLLAIEAAVAGRGIALSPTALVAEDLAAGRLVRWGSMSVPDTNAHWLLCRKDKVNWPAVQTFRAWIKAELAHTTVDS